MFVSVFEFNEGLQAEVAVVPEFDVEVLAAADLHRGEVDHLGINFQRAVACHSFTTHVHVFLLDYEGVVLLGVRVEFQHFIQTASNVLTEFLEVVVAEAEILHFEVKLVFALVHRLENGFDFGMTVGTYFA